jgi:predicted HicB family RNase H-like nuclease|tara:strand:- start:504 stop:650 length:147 start_codon:yes stop_codon:yes gene_type:complete
MDKSKQTVNVNMRLTVSDLEALEREALESKESLSTYCRKKLTQNFKQE